MSPLPMNMRDRWSNRAETPAGHGTVYWHILMGGDAQVRDAATRIQGKLSRFSGFHMTPLDNLHITTLVVGAASEITRDQMATLVAEARDLLVSVPPIPVTINRILYHPEAIMLNIDPVDALSPVLLAAQSATRAAAGHDGSINESATWTPHVTVAYSTTAQPTAPIIETIRKEIEPLPVTVNSISLVIQWGSERQWKWEQFETVSLGD